MRSNSFCVLRTAARCSQTQVIGRIGTKHGVRWSSSERQWSTPLAKSLAEAITTTGPIPVASYMRQCLTSPEGGYYTRKTPDHDQFGTKGDFITSPEISQVFGELVGLWLYTEWLAQGRRERVHIIEVGPGRGTLMDDVLRTISTFKPFAKSIEAIYLVEASTHLRKKQAQLLSGSEELRNTDIGWTTTCKYLPTCEITWCEDIRFVPQKQTATPFILAHEFFDALPIHVFQNMPSSIPASPTILTPTGPVKPKYGHQASKNQWHELVVSPTPSHSTSQISSTSLSREKDLQPEFQLTVSKTPTPHSLYLPQISERYKALQNTQNAIIEISPESLSYMSDFAVRIGGTSSPKSLPAHPAAHSPSSSSTIPFIKPQPSGAALILDYGPASTIPANTLRGIQSHKTVSPFTSPGIVDLSADVDFLALAEAALAASPSVEVHGPVEQAFFLSAMGIKERAERLVKNARSDDGKGVTGRVEEGEVEIIKRLESGWKRLVDRGPTGMGRIYKAMALVPFIEGDRVRRPVGFGGDVVG